MPGPTPRDAAPATERRKDQVALAMSALGELEGLDVAEQFTRLEEAAGVLAQVLSGGPVAHPRIPGIPGNP